MLRASFLYEVFERGVCLPQVAEWLAKQGADLFEVVPLEVGCQGVCPLQREREAVRSV